MSVETDDLALLRRYAENGCEEAFAALVARHVHHVYSVARRECNGAHQAEEVTQAAFIILARKAGRLPSNTILSGWLFRTVRYVARNARRAEQRRRSCEEEVAHMPANDPREETVWEQIAPSLNDALAGLSHADRDAITLRFFEKKSHAEIAVALRTNETAARKRLSRAIDRLRAGLSRRGVVIPVAVLTTALTSHAVETAPLTLSSGLTAAAVNAGSATSALATTTMKLMAWTKLKLAGAAAIVLLCTGSAAVMLLAPASKDDPWRRTLADGSTFTLVRAEMASQIQFRYPENPGANQPSSSMSLVSLNSEETFFVGTTHEGGTGKIQIGRVQVASDEGSVFDGIFSGGTLVLDKGRFQAWRLYAFPRRGSNLTLRFFYPDASGRWARATEMTVPNPAPGPFNEWTAGVLPQAQTNGDLIVNLVEFDAGAAQRRHQDGMSSFWRKLPGTHCAFSLHQAGKKTAPWIVRSLEVSDATGNRWKQSDLVSWADADETEPRLHTSMAGALWASEPAWNLRVELSRTNDFLPDEQIALSNIPVPQADELIPLHDTHLVNGVDLEVAAIAGANAELTQPHKWLRNKGRMSLALTMHGEIRHKRITLVEVRDDQGRPVPFEKPAPTSGRKECVFGFQPRPDARSLSFKVAVHESRFVEFRAKPSILSSGRAQR